MFMIVEGASADTFTFAIQNNQRSLPRRPLFLQILMLCSALNPFLRRTLDFLLSYKLTFTVICWKEIRDWAETISLLTVYKLRFYFYQRSPCESLKAYRCHMNNFKYYWVCHYGKWSMGINILIFPVWKVNNYAFSLWEFRESFF